MAKAGQMASAPKEMPATMACGAEPPSPRTVGSGKAATSTVATPPPPRSNRPGRAASRKARAVVMCARPTPASAEVITQRSVASSAARALIVWVNESNPTSCRAAAHVQPPINRVGAAAEDSRPHQGAAFVTASRLVAPGDAGLGMQPDSELGFDPVGDFSG